MSQKYSLRYLPVLHFLDLLDLEELQDVFVMLVSSTDDGSFDLVE